MHSVKGTYLVSLGDRVVVVHGPVIPQGCTRQAVIAEGRNGTPARTHDKGDLFSYPERILGW